MNKIQEYFNMERIQIFNLKFDQNIKMKMFHLPNIYETFSPFQFSRKVIKNFAISIKFKERNN